MEMKKSACPQVVIFPLPMQGPVKSMLNLAKLLWLSSEDLYITCLTTEYVRDRLLHSAGGGSKEDNPRLQLHTFSDGLPEDHPRGGDKFMEMLDTVKQVSHPILREITKRCSFNCIISDGLYDFALDVGKEAGIPVFYLETMSPSCLSAYLCLPGLLRAGEVPFRGNEELDAIVNVPSMESLQIRRRDLPDFFRARYPTDHMMIEQVLGQVQQFQRAQGIILNTFEGLDSPSLSYIRSYCPNQKIYAIGPLHLHLKKSLLTQQNTDHNSASFWQEDTSCIAWLDKQSPRSVIYCSFGSQVVVTKDQLIEFWYGLVNSGSLFLWIKRPGSVVGLDDDDQIPKDLLEGIKKKGLVVSWVPQEKVLSHPAIGGFLTHCGWNSTIESIAIGVPMVCWPHYVDQLVNSRLVSKIWKLGVDIKDTCNRFTIEKAVNDIMSLRKEESLERASEFANLATQSLHYGGSSSCSLETLIDDIRSFMLLKPNA